MPSKQPLDLSRFDGRLMDGLTFCRRVYDFFDQIRASPDGVKKIRMRPTKTEKRLIEELIAIAWYVQTRYRADRRIKVRWLSGSQQYDAVLLSRGNKIEHSSIPRRVFLEVTRAVHPNEHLSRELINQGLPSFGVKGTSRDKKTKQIISVPYVHQGDERITDLALQIIERINSKSAKNYPPNTVLVVDCIPNGIIYAEEWKDTVARVEKQVKVGFAEIFIFCAYLNHSATLWASSK